MGKYRNFKQSAVSRSGAQSLRNLAIGPRVLAVVVLALGFALIAASAASAQSQRPAAQPQWLVFSARVAGGFSTEQLFRISLAGTGLKQLTTGTAPAEAPAVSPDGTRIAFARLGDGLFSMDVNGTGVRRLTGNARDGFPAWSPDGTRIAFLRPTVKGWELHVMSASGADERRLPQAPRAGRPTWTKLGLVIPTEGDLAKVNGLTGQVQKRFDAFIDVFVGMTATAVAPDLSRIAFVGSRPSDPGDKDCGEGVPCPRFALYLQNLSTHKDPTLLVRDTGPGAFSPDGKTLAYVVHEHIVLRDVVTGAVTIVKTGKASPTTSTPPAWLPR